MNIKKSDINSKGNAMETGIHYLMVFILSRLIQNLSDLKRT